MFQINFIFYFKGTIQKYAFKISLNTIIKFILKI